MKKLTQQHVVLIAKEKLGSTAKLAERLEISESFLRHIMCGDRPIPYKKIRLLAKITSPEITESQIFDLRTKP